MISRSRDSVLVVGSKAIGLAVQERLRAAGLLAGVITVDDSTDPRSRLAAMRAIGATVVTDRKEASQAMSRVKADAVVVAGWYWLIGPEQLRARPHIGIHHSLLPRYRGGSPLVWSLIRGDRVVGTSLFTLTDEMDAGEIGHSARSTSVLLRTSTTCSSDGMPWPWTYFPRPSIPRRGHGLRISPWQPGALRGVPRTGRSIGRVSAEEIVRSVRAQSRPYPGAFTDHETGRITIWRARSDARQYFGRPGEVVRLDGGGFGVLCGDDHRVVVEESSEAIRQGWRFRSHA